MKPTPEPAAPENGSPAMWERDLLNRLLFAALREQRRARRWGIFFKLALSAYLLALFVLYLPEDIRTPHAGKAHTAVVRLDGIIAEDEEASADRVISGLRAAFEDEDTKGVVLRINSPGGSPVQAGYINDEITRLRGEYPDIPLHAVIADVCASGGYYVAVAADRIYADKSSVVGSIGALLSGFGFVEAMEKLGIERRLLTSSVHKGLYDSFSPVNPREESHLQSLLGELHRLFVEEVREGRGDRLRGEEKKLFSGLVWSGEQAVGLGLVDGLGSSGYVAREVIGAEEIVDFTWERDYLERFAERFGATVGKTLATGLATTSSHWNLQ